MTILGILGSLAAIIGSYITFRLVFLTALLGTFTVVLTQIPDAQPLPLEIETGLTWFLNQMYFFDAIFPVSVFYEQIVIMVEVYLWFIFLWLFVKAVKWVLPIV